MYSTCMHRNLSDSEVCIGVDWNGMVECIGGGGGGGGGGEKGKLPPPAPVSAATAFPCSLGSGRCY